MLLTQHEREEVDRDAAMAVQSAHAGVPEKGPQANQNAERLLVFLPTADAVAADDAGYAFPALNGRLIMTGKIADRHTHPTASGPLARDEGRLLRKLARLRSEAAF
jgi:hypothetical protein